MTEPARVRPALHFTSREGFTNDPHGVTYFDGTYHMFFQHNPAGVNWSPKCYWGHAISYDLITWNETEPALRPEAEEIGCWSGSVAIDERGPAILYTRIDADHWANGQVALARPRRGMFDWVRTPPRAVIDGPPEGLGIIAFRDPQVRRQDGAWNAILGGGIDGFGGCALQYSSPDLEQWTFDGIIASRSTAERDPVWTGAVWECPQLVRLDGEWALITSTWADHIPYSVAYAIGRYDGAAFVARAYGPFSHGPELYATTTFRDAEGRPCAMSWLRERGGAAPEGSPWCSAMSLPHLIRIEDGRLAVSQHPALDGALSVESDAEDVAPSGSARIGLADYVWRLRFRAEPFAGFDINVAGDGGSFMVQASSASLSIYDAAGAERLTMHLSALDASDVDIVVDADIIEITLSGAEGIASTRVPVVARGELRVSPRGSSTICAVRFSTRSNGDGVT